MSIELVIKIRKTSQITTRHLRVSLSDTVHDLKHKIAEKEKALGQPCSQDMKMLYNNELLECTDTLDSLRLDGGATIVVQPEQGGFDFQTSAWYGTAALFARSQKNPEHLFSALPEFQQKCGCPVSQILIPNIRCPRDSSFVWKSWQMVGCPDADTITKENIRLQRITKGRREEVEGLVFDTSKELQNENGTYVFVADLRPAFPLEVGRYIFSINSPVKPDNRIRKVNGGVFPGPLEVPFFISGERLEGREDYFVASDEEKDHAEREGHQTPPSHQRPAALAIDSTRSHDPDESTRSQDFERGDEEGKRHVQGQDPATVLIHLPKQRAGSDSSQHQARPGECCERSYICIPYPIRCGLIFGVWGLVVFVILVNGGKLDAPGVIVGAVSAAAWACFLSIAAIIDRWLVSGILAANASTSGRPELEDPSRENRWINRHYGVYSDYEPSQFQKCCAHGGTRCAVLIVVTILTFVGGWLLAYRFIDNGDMGDLANNTSWNRQSP